MHRFCLLIATFCGLLLPSGLSILGQEHPLPARAVCRLQPAWNNTDVFIRSLCFLDERHLLIGVLEDDKVPMTCWDITTKKRLPLPPLQNGRENCKARSGDGRYLALSVWGQKVIHVWDVKTWRKVRELRWKDDTLLSSPLPPVMTFSADGRRLAAVTADVFICVWDVIGVRR